MCHFILISQELRCFFCPVHDKEMEHFVLYVVNTRAKKIQYMDPSEEMLVEREKLGMVLAWEVRRFLEIANHPEAISVVDYEFENIQFLWKSNAGFSNDCAVFVMKLMSFYEGELPVVCPELKEVISRRRIRAEIAASLFLSDNNSLRTNIVLTWGNGGK